jgi:hypothetical protein
MIPGAARQVTLSMKYGANAKAGMRLASRRARISAIGG